MSTEISKLVATEYQWFRSRSKRILTHVGAKFQALNEAYAIPRRAMIRIKQVEIAEVSQENYASHGFRTGTNDSWKSRALRETMVKLWWSAVAASKPSRTGNGLSFRFASAAMEPHRLAISALIGRIRPANLSCRSTSNHVSRRVLRLPGGSPATPFRISPNVSTLRCSVSSLVPSIHRSTRGSGDRRTSSERQFVSSKYPLTA